MSKTSRLDELVQQLDTLSLEQLLEVRERVNALIQRKGYESALNEIDDLKNSSFAESLTSLSLFSCWDLRKRSTPPDIDLVLLAKAYKASKDKIKAAATAAMAKSVLANWLLIDGEDSPPEDVDAEDETLEDAIKLVEEWMGDESGYDEETYPQIEAALNQNRLSL
jgi:hypothetical protein